MCIRDRAVDGQIVHVPGQDPVLQAAHLLHLAQLAVDIPGIFDGEMCIRDREAGWFDFDDVVNGVAQKLVFRHPYVFGNGQAADADGALNAWERQKRQEKDQRTTADALNAVARSLPALMRAEKIQEKAKKAGFDWDCIGPMLDKITEEAQELRQAVDEHSNIEEELGDLLFVTAKAGRFFGLDSELALHTCLLYTSRCV